MQTRAQPARRQLCLALLASALPRWAPAQASPALTITLADGTRRQLDLAELQALPTQAVSMKRRDGTPYMVTGVAVTQLLKLAGLDLSQNLGASFIAGHVLVARAADGYRAVFGLAVADPHFGTPPLLVTWMGDDGSPLASNRGPLQLIHTTEARPVRWVRQLVAIDVKAP
jgi:hypothetical protein